MCYSSLNYKNVFVFIFKKANDNWLIKNRQQITNTFHQALWREVIHTILSMTNSPWQYITDQGL